MKMNERGSILVNALVVTVILAVISGVILSQSLLTVKNLRLPRVKAAMTAVEGSIRYALFQPSSYDNCVQNAGSDTCVLDVGVIAALQETSFVGCQPEPGQTQCGIFIDAVPGTPLFDPTAREFNALIRYSGTELAVKPVPVKVIVPVEVLQHATILCPETAPIFTGFDSNGLRQCRQIANNDCGAGQYLADFDANNLSVVCRPIDPVLADGCSNINEFVSDLNFSASGVNSSCAPRPPPSARW